MDPIFWLGLSILLVAVSIAAVLIVAVPAIQELGRAARSVEKLFDTLHRELPPTLEALRLTGLEITELTDDMTEGVQNASKIAQNVDHSITGVKQQVHQAQVTTRSVMAGFRAAWKTLQEDEPAAPPRPSADRAVLDPPLAAPSAAPPLAPTRLHVSLDQAPDRIVGEAHSTDTADVLSPAERDH
jgi:uncharacterized protein YoxC